MIEQEIPAYRFGDFELQPEERRLLQAGEAVPLTPKVFEILHLLVGRAGHAVSKDEIMAAIWPGRFVAESNLTKHIWTLRQALGEDGEGEGFIETLPKLGYRFLAPVSREEVRASQPAAELPPVEPTAMSNESRARTAPDLSMDSWWRRLGAFRAGAAAASIVVVAALAAWWVWNGREPVFPWSHRAPGTAVAVFDFDNLSRDGKQAWIGTAFPEMLGVEMTQGGQLHLLPAELIHAVRGQAPERGASGFSPSTLAQLRRQLAVDYVVTGGYFASNKNDSAVRLDLALQDARSGATVATFTHTGSADDLPSLASKAGADLRQDLNLRPQSADERRLAANASPPSTDVMRHIGFGLEALHRYDSARARDELLQAIADAPDYAPSYVYLAKAWSQLGYDQKALAAAKQAAAHAAGLPEFMRLRIQTREFEAQHDWKRAIQTLRTLATLEQGDPEVQLELIDALLSAGRPQDAEAVLDTLQQNAAMAGDARRELAAGQVANAQGDTRARQVHTERALALARARGNPGLAADSELALGVVFTSGDRAKARDMLTRALADYERVKNPHGVARVHLNIGNLLSDTQPNKARAEYEESLKQSQAIGDQNGIAAAYSDLAIMLWSAGDRDGTEAALRNVLRIRRVTGSVEGQAWALANLAVLESDERASSEVIAEFREAAALDASIGDHAHRAYTLVSLSDVFRLRGELEEARRICTEALAEAAKVKDHGSDETTQYGCAQLALDRGDVAAAQAEIARARAAAVRINDLMMRTNTDVMLGQINAGQKDWPGALPLFRAAETEYAEGAVVTGQAVAASFVALGADAIGDARSRDAALARARALRSRITERREVIRADINLAELQGDNGQKDEAISQLHALAADARQRSWPGWALEAELAELHVLRKTGGMSRVAALKAQIAEEAKRLGFGWVLQRARRT